MNELTYKWSSIVIVCSASFEKISPALNETQIYVVMYIAYAQNITAMLWRNDYSALYHCTGEKSFYWPFNMWCHWRRVGVLCYTMIFSEKALHTVTIELHWQVSSFNWLIIQQTQVIRFCVVLDSKILYFIRTIVQKIQVIFFFARVESYSILFFMILNFDWDFSTIDKRLLLLLVI